MLFADKNGSGKHIAIPDARKPGRPKGSAIHGRSAKAERGCLWLHLLEYGRVDAKTGQRIRYTVADIARLWGVTEKTIRRGIRQARQIEEQVEAACREDE
jgi:hypothetical protein